jgi:phage terminase small subunit
MASPEEFSVREIKAISGLMRGLTQREAMLAAGYSQSYADEAHKFFAQEKIREEIARRKKRLARRNDLDAEWVLQRLMKIADANLGDVLYINEEGDPEIDWNNLTPELRYALTGGKIRKYTKGRGPNAIPVTEFSPTFACKLKALELLMRHLGLFEDKVKLEGDKDLIDALKAGRSRVRGSETDDDGSDEEEGGE